MSFGGNNTPITSSDEDDDIDQAPASSAAGGNFTESHLESGYHSTQHNQTYNGGTPMSEGSDLDDADPHRAHHHNTEQFWVQIVSDGDIKRFAIGPTETLSDLRLRINDQQDMAMTQSHHFCLGPDADDNNISDDEDEHDLIQRGRLLDDEQIPATRYHGETLSIYWSSFELSIVDGLDLSLTLRVAQDWTIGAVKEEAERQHSVRLQCLSHKGNELTDDWTLAYYEIKEGGFTLVSRVSITVEDLDCEIATDLLICDFWDFEKVLATYLEVERREFHQNARFLIEGEMVRDLKESAFVKGLANRGKVVYKVESYPINIYDSESAMAHSAASGVHGGDLNAVTLFVYDQWTLNDVKKAYSKMTKKPFMEREKLLSQERELEDEVPLWKLRLRDNEKLIIEREQQEAVVTYICCECGQRVELRRYDSVQCRQCFHGAVYKQRTSRVCQYSCR